SRGATRVGLLSQTALGSFALKELIANGRVVPHGARTGHSNREEVRMARSPVPEARLTETEAGMKPEGDGWFVVNVADSMSIGIDEGQYGFIFEPEPQTFPHFGINVTVLGPGEPGAMYHAEAGQEAFLVLEGECVLVVEDEER